MTDADKPDERVISIQGADVRRIEFHGDPVVTFAMVDNVHKRPEGTAYRNYADNRERFIEGEDYVLVRQSQSYELRSLGIDVPNRGLTVLTRRGYLKLTKPMNDDRAWQVQADMIDRYFASERPKVDAPSITAEDLLSNPMQLLAITQGYALQIEDMKRDMAIMQQDVAVVDRFGRADDWFGLRRSSKMVDIPERKFTEWLQRNGWAYRPVAGKGLLGYADKQKKGYCKNVPHPYTRPDGTEGVRDQLVFSMTGLIRIAKLLNVTLRVEEDA